VAALPTLRRDHWLALGGILAAAALCWAWVVAASLDMNGRMDGLAAWMMQPRWDLRYGLLIFAMWSVMMAAMMVPSAIPAIVLYGRVVGAKASPQRPLARTYLFAGGYLLAWCAFSAAATALQWGLAQAALLSPMMQASSPLLAAVLLWMAGIWQWLPIKDRCLTQCRSPLMFLSLHWRPGLGGALRLGARHGLFCVGCCWALMLLLFVGGIMSLLWIVLITAFVLIEKLAPRNLQRGRLSGALLVGAGVWVLV
jgi:predicted metal-binding membrane protein